MGIVHAGDRVRDLGDSCEDTSGEIEATVGSFTWFPELRIGS